MTKNANASVDSTTVNHVTIVVPVYRDYEVTRRCLDSLLASELLDNDQVLVINDASPDSQVVDYCQQLAELGQIELINNPQNIGFVASANRGFDHNQDADVMLLNSDTEVAGSWLQRIKACGQSDSSIGTVTPFSNNATICSYPASTHSNTLPANYSQSLLDELFAQANPKQCSDIPTAVGFCMYIKRQCLKQTGYFDVENFGQGYGEECDFSVRAANKGWRNVLACDVFVYHEGGVSFASETNERKQQADQVMRRLHPDYDQSVQDFLSADPLARYRHKVNLLRAKQFPADIETLLLEQQQENSQMSVRLAEQYRAYKATDQALGEAHKRLVELSQHNDPALVQSVSERDEYKRLYNKTLEQLQLTDQANEELQSLVKLRDTQLAETQEAAAGLEAHVAELAQVLRKQQTDIEQLNLVRDEETAARTKLIEQLQQSSTDFDRTDAALGEAQLANQQLHDQVSQLEQRANLAEQELAAHVTSRSWRYTAWLRKIGGDS